MDHKQTHKHRHHYTIEASKKAPLLFSVGGLGGHGYIEGRRNIGSDEIRIVNVTLHKVQLNVGHGCY